jgi:hypothetical protein
MDVNCSNKYNYLINFVYQQVVILTGVLTRVFEIEILWRDSAKKQTLSSIAQNKLQPPQRISFCREYVPFNIHPKSENEIND